jgi:secreted Zn-dependent insulinase-like peptidase
MIAENNETLNPEKNEEITNKLRGYHSLIKRSENIFFTLFSNETIDKLEKFTEKYFTYLLFNYFINKCYILSIFI